MGNLRKSIKLRIDWTRIVFSLIAFFLIVETCLAFERKYNLRKQIHQRLLSARAELAGLQDENLQLRKEKESLYTSGKIEQLARKKLGLAKADEITIQIIQPSEKEHEKKGKAENSSKSLWVQCKAIWNKLKEAVSGKWFWKSEPS